MPAKNTTKPYAPNSYYHLYNRGVEKRTIFTDDQDYNVFLSYLKTYLLPKNLTKLYDLLNNPNSSRQQKSQARKLIRLNNFSDTLQLMAYCLMPNHFHFLVKQTKADTIDKFINSLGTRYTMYFNKKHQRIGKLYQGAYKAVIIDSDPQLLHLTRYIHRNPLPILNQQPLITYPYSSYTQYLEKINRDWVKPQEILSFFSSTNPLNSYQYFVEEHQETPPNTQSLFLEPI